MQMKNSFNRKIFLAVAVILAVAGGLVWAAFFWQFERLKAISENIQKEQLDSQVRAERNQKVIELGKELGDVELRSKEMEAMLVDKENAVPFLKFIEDIANQTGNSVKISVVDLAKIKTAQKKPAVVQETEPESKKDLQKEEQAQKSAPAKEQKPDFSGQLGFSVELTGECRSVLDFFAKFENMPYFARVFSFKLSPAAKTQSVPAAGSGAENGKPAIPEGNKKITANIVITAYTNEAK